MGSSNAPATRTARAWMPWACSAGASGWVAGSAGGECSRRSGAGASLQPRSDRKQSAAITESAPGTFMHDPFETMRKSPNHCYPGVVQKIRQASQPAPARSSGMPSQLVMAKMTFQNTLATWGT